MRFGNVHLSARARTSLVAAAMEVYPRETNGILLCQPRQGHKVIIDGVYSIQTAERKWTSVKHGNISAIKRMSGAISLLDGRNLIGGFHSHPDSDAELSDDDVVHIQQEIERFRELGVPIERWLEIVVSITRVDYSQPKDPGWSSRSYESKLGLMLRNPDRNGTALSGYHMIAGAYWLFEDSDDFWSREVKLRLLR